LHEPVSLMQQTETAQLAEQTLLATYVRLTRLPLANA
jgi:hypothetical protein